MIGNRPNFSVSCGRAQVASFVIRERVDVRGGVRTSTHAGPGQWQSPEPASASEPSAVRKRQW
jgi:hypothetical protein